MALSPTTCFPVRRTPIAGVTDPGVLPIHVNLRQWRAAQGDPHAGAAPLLAFARASLRRHLDPPDADFLDTWIASPRRVSRSSTRSGADPTVRHAA